MTSIIYIKYDPTEVKFKYFYDAWKIYICIKYLGTFMYVFRLNIQTCKQILILQIF